jgi:hypothetical protein
MENRMVHDQRALASVLDCLTAGNRRDWAAFETLQAPDVVYESPHSHAVGRRAVVRRFQELVALVPDLWSSELRLIENFYSDDEAMFEYVQTGTLFDEIASNGELHGPGSPFVVHTTMFVSFDHGGRITGWRTLHR